MVEIRMPKMGESIVEGTVGQVFKKTGDIVREGEEICEIETDKVNQQIQSPASGTLTLHVKQGDTVKIDALLATVAPGAATPAPTAPPPRKGVDEFLQAKPTKPEPAKQEPAQPEPARPEPVKPQAPRQAGRESRSKMSKLRQVIAKKLVEVKNETAMLTTFNEVDMSKIIQLRETEQEAFVKKHGVKLGFMSFFVKACVAALQQYPMINSRIEKDEIVTHHFYDIGVAVGTEKGLFVPVIRDADKLSYAGIEKALKTYAEKAKGGTITVDEMQGGTFTITNGGVYGSMLSTPILNPPQSGILGMHNIVKRAVVINDEIVIRPIMYLALSYDHRIVDGKESIGFLMAVKKALEEPTRLLLDL